MVNRCGSNGNNERLYFGGLQKHCRWWLCHETKRYLLFGRRDITLLINVLLVKTMVFPLVMYGCESWTIKKTERRRIDAFKLWCLRRFFRVPWTARRSNQSILKSTLNIHLKDWCWSSSSNTLTAWYKELTQQKRLWCWERLKQKEKRVAKDEMVR